MVWLLAQLVPLGVLCAAKRFVVGAYATGDAPYYGDLHHKWVFMMSLGSVTDDLLDAVQGTCLCGNQPVRRVLIFSAMARPRWLRRAVRNRHRHAIEQASRRWRGGRRDDSARR